MQAIRMLEVTLSAEECWMRMVVHWLALLLLVENTLLGVSSDKDGAFELNRLRTGNYILKVSYMGYDSKEIPVELTGNIAIDVKLNPSALMCEEVVVSATRATTRMPLAQSTMGKEQSAPATQVLTFPIYWRCSHRLWLCPREEQVLVIQRSVFEEQTTHASMLQ
jgi:hypothetical protein